MLLHAGIKLTVKDCYGSLVITLTYFYGNVYNCVHIHKKSKFLYRTA